MLKERPSVELRKGHFWHIGNVKIIDDFGGYCAVGRTTKSIVERYDQRSGNFIEEPLDTSPYMHVLFDSRIGFVAIAKKPKLSPTVVGIARRLRGLLEKTSVSYDRGIKVSLDPISDPHDFIDSIRAAYSVKSFEVTFSRPNPFDADEFFRKPIERYLDSANGEKGKTYIIGNDLDPETLVSVTQSAAATGNDAKAVMKTDEKARYLTKRLKVNPAHFQLAEDEFTIGDGLDKSRHLYTGVRGQDDTLDNAGDSE